jgi:glycerol kinase
VSRYILALDQGTSSSRAILFDEEAKPVASSGREFPQIYPQPGWVEHDPEEIWSSQLGAAQDVLRETGVAPSRVAAIGITNQRETTVVWEKESGRPVCNAVVWQCRRTADLCDDLKRRGREPAIRERTGLVVDAYFSATKLQWILDRVPDARSRAAKGELLFGNVDAWLVYRLTGGRVHATDYTNASRTMLYNIYRREWDSELLEEFGVPEAMLPQVHPSSEVLGETDPTLLGAAIPIAGIAGDQQAALFGQACFEAGLGKNTYGTGCFVLLNTGEQGVPSQRGLVTTIGTAAGGRVQYALEGSIFIAGAAIQWLRDGLRILENAAESEALASAVPSSDGVYLVPAFVGLGAPHWDMYARGAVVGITRGTTREHLVRATLESIAFQTRDVLEAMEAESGIALRELRVDGGAVANDLLMQIQADFLGRPVLRPVVTETTAQGAAYLAGLAVGLWPDLERLGRHWRLDRRFEPRMPEDQRQELYEGWKRALERAKGWVQPSAASG